MFKYFYNFVDKFKTKLSQKGQGMVEYALIIAFVAAIAAVALNSNLGTAVQNAFAKAATAINGAGSSTSTSTGTSGSGGTSGGGTGGTGSGS